MKKAHTIRYRCSPQACLTGTVELNSLLLTAVQCGCTQLVQQQQYHILCLPLTRRSVVYIPNVCVIPIDAITVSPRDPPRNQSPTEPAACSINNNNDDDDNEGEKIYCRGQSKSKSGRAWAAVETRRWCFRTWLRCCWACFSAAMRSEGGWQSSGRTEYTEQCGDGDCRSMQHPGTTGGS